MNSEHIQDYLEHLQSNYSRCPNWREECEEAGLQLEREEEKARTIMHYVQCNYTDVDALQGVVGQILAAYYKGGALREFALQFVPTLMGVYLIASSKKQHKSTSVLETFFLAVYNEEIIDATPMNAYAKKVEEVRIASIRFPSIYHDPSKLYSVPEITTMKPGHNTQSVQSIIRIGPYPTMERMNAENKYIILTRLMRSVNSSMCFVSCESVGRQLCLAVIAIASSGFTLPDSEGLRAKVLPVDVPSEVIDDYSKKPRIGVSSMLLVELLVGVHLALYNGSPDLALRALDCLHFRAQYEMLPEVLVLTSALRNGLMESAQSSERREELIPRAFKEKKRRELVTNASLRMKRLPDDIPVMESKEKEHTTLTHLVDDTKEKMDQLKKKMQSHAHKLKHRRKSTSTDEETELQAIAEDGTSEDKPVGRRKGDREGEKSESAHERGAFTVQHTFRHADSASSSARSVDYS